MNELAIVVMAYNRPATLQRLLKSLAAAEVPANTSLIISIDDAPRHPDVIQIAADFVWLPGPKEIREQPDHLGLKPHYLRCGDLTDAFRGIILLEDDLVVARPFFHFAEHALTQFEQDTLVAGVSLNTLWFNGYSHYRFTPLLDANDLFFLPIPWYQGQILWREQWRPFRKWLATGQGTIQATDPLHPSYATFAADEWFPAYLKYLVVTGRYFAFPRQSYSTNYGDIGTHFPQRSDLFQVPLQQYRYQFNLAPLADSLAVYDSFFEILPSRLKQLAPWLDCDGLTIDLNGLKPAHARQSERLLTSQPVRKAERRFALQRRPIEANIIEQVDGQSLALTAASLRRDDPIANWLRLYRLDRYYRRQRPAPRWPRLIGRLLE